MADEIATRGMFVSVSGACECCEEVQASAAVLLERFTDDLLPPKGTTRGPRVTVRDAAEEDAGGEIDQLILDQLRRVAASGFGHIDDDGVIVVPGVVVAACGNGH